MTSATRIRELVDDLLASGGSASEDVQQLDLHGRLDELQLKGWAEVLSGQPIFGIASISVMDALGDQVDLTLAGPESAGQELRIRVVKRISPTTAFCFTADGVGAVFASFNVIASITQVWVACDFFPFRTENCRIDVWTDVADEAPSIDADVRVPDPRRLVKDFIGERVPKTVFPYLLTSEVPAQSTVFDAWKAIAVVRLLYALVNEVFSAEGEFVVITGTRPRKIVCNLHAPYSEELFVAVTEAARWVYASGRDVDTRFALFTYELSREWPDALGLQDGFGSRGGHALEAAKTAFQAHVQETSKDTLKSLGDLRKTLSEEVTKVVSQTRDLLGTMWRDFMVAATVYLGRVVLLGSDKPLSDPAPLRASLFGAAVFLIFSLVISWRTNRRFMRIAEDSRGEWRKRLYGFMSEDDFKKLCVDPLDASTRAYTHVARWVTIAYVAVVFGLVWSACHADSKAMVAKSVSDAQVATLPTGAPPASGVSAFVTPASSNAASAAVADRRLPQDSSPASGVKAAGPNDRDVAAK